MDSDTTLVDLPPPARAGRRSTHTPYTTPTPHPQTQTRTHTHDPAHAGRRSIPQEVPPRAMAIGDTHSGSAAPPHPRTPTPPRDTRRARRRSTPRTIPESVSSTRASPPSSATTPATQINITPTPTPKNVKIKSLYDTKRGPLHRALSRRVSSLQIIISETTALVLHPRRRAQPPSRGLGVIKDQEQPSEGSQDAANLQMRAMLASVVAQKKQEEVEEARLWALLDSNGRPVLGGEQKFGRVRLRMRTNKGRERMCGFEMERQV
ncbi:hypothetical protein C8F04DRAFT_1248305 [Mycena alexandri]|uniref:Uncharacterized protein n=1 Tax=Mycena alexandri TaxID=1745969 RepID=A0AAD6XF71_9AGAR|nr:hypothetical protein C8F04DRAFT_1248305 [Mycena alexandri]